VTQPPPYGPPQYPPPPPAGHPPRRPGTNGFAIASLIFGLVGGVVFGVIFGIVGLVQTRRRPQAGKGLAVAGLVLSGLWLVGAVAIGVLVALTSDPDAGDRVKVQTLRPGDCVNGLDENSATTSLPTVPCTEPHDGEVYAVFDLAGGDYPGEDEAGRLAQIGCIDRKATHAAKVADDSNFKLFLLYPNRPSWGSGDHAVTCIAMDARGSQTGSIQD
jgi:hypothetical protein